MTRRAKGKVRRSFWMLEFLNLSGEWHPRPGILYSSKYEAELDMRGNSMPGRWRTAQYCRVERLTTRKETCEMKAKPKFRVGQFAVQKENGEAYKVHRYWRCFDGRYEYELIGATSRCFEDELRPLTPRETGARKGVKRGVGD